ncbi:hypothetical protein Q9Q94_14950 [Uliginosibacterium sp. 31-16]|uniref:rhamnogalacturonan lyase family protein n=1 Tax=Uliginosibacterium sp. 31-16 TaxID=3068315 RepID=UPI00273EAFFB|nr:hypothetical protein [Uliginosibacterium sp. 31-16]MDP5240841.1 hypothetical protein [Uliginosibacterium sp. 31-16]
MTEFRKLTQLFGVSALAALLAACGGGASSGNSSETASVTPEPTLSYDLVNESEHGATLYQSSSARYVEKLDRGLIAVQSGKGWFLSWRLFGTEYGSKIAFDVYKGETRLNSAPITDATSFQDDSAGTGTYSVRAIVDGTKYLARSKPALALTNGYLEIPLKTAPSGVASDYYVQHAWPADLDGDGQYEFVIARLPYNDKSAQPCLLEAYKLDGSFLWRVDMGPNSYAQAPGIGLNDSPPASISGFGNIAGYRNDDMVTVFDLDGDGKAEVLVRTATGVTFADGRSIVSDNVANQFISVIKGATGAEVTRLPLTDLVEHGPAGGQFGIAYLDGIHPSLVTQLTTRGLPAKKGIFHFMVAAWDFDGKSLTNRWKWFADNEKTVTTIPERFHQIRVVDLDGDGKDEFIGGNYALNSDGTLRYVVDKAGHGDRLQIGEFDPLRPGLEGFGIQQSELGIWSNFPWYYYDASSGTRLITGQHPPYIAEKAYDVARGTAADIDPRHPGYEFWTSLSDPTLPSSGMYNVKGERLTTNVPGANFRIWWDGDEGSELLDGVQQGAAYVGKWDPASETVQHLFDPAGVILSWRGAPPFYGDVLGDWREEILLETSDRTALRLFSTNLPTRKRLYTLAHDPEYRLGFTVRGYAQSLLVDYYLGYDMNEPPKPNIRTLR